MTTVHKKIVYDKKANGCITNGVNNMNYECKIEYEYQNHLVRYVIQYMPITTLFYVNVILSVPNKDEDIVESYIREIKKYKKTLKMLPNKYAEIMPMDTNHNMGMSHTLVFLTDDINDFHVKFKTFSAAIDAISAKLWEEYE